MKKLLFLLLLGFVFVSPIWAADPPPIPPTPPTAPIAPTPPTNRPIPPTAPIPPTPPEFHFPVCQTHGPDFAHCHAKFVASDSKGKPRVNPGPVGYGPIDFQTAYKFASQSASGRTLAIIDAYDHPNIKSDLDIYSSTFGLPPAPSFTKIDQNGGTNYPKVDSGWALEIALDVEIAHAACPDCKLLLVEANSNSYNDLMAAVDRAVTLGASVVSNSYGSNEFSRETSFDFHFNHPGVAFTFSSGDSGYGVEYPAASRYVTAVGGTSLFLNPDHSYSTETAWSGAGSGCSSYESKPSFQKDTGCFHRTVADVSADADPNTGAAIYDSVAYFGQTGWFQVGGTSLAAPLVAAAYALGGIGPTIQANSLPYTHISSLHDITVGNNGHCRRSSYLCTAVPGFDGPTGLGSPFGIIAF